MSEFSISEEFITEAVNKYSDTLFRIALNITKNEEDSFDVCQDVFVRLIRNKNKIKSQEHLKAWLIRVTVNCAKSSCMQAYKRHKVDFESLTAADIIQYDNYDTMIDSVMKLPEKYSTVIHLFYYEDMQINEIAQTLHLKPSTVKQRLARGRERLKKLLDKEDMYGA